MAHTLKWFPRSRLYKASNVWYSPDTLESASYNWWWITRRADNFVLFNSYRYSPSTSQHQAKVRAVLERTLPTGLKIIDVEAPRGLQDLDSARAHCVRRIEELGALISRPRSRHANNEVRREMIQQYCVVDKFLAELLRAESEARVCVTKELSR